MPINWYKIIFSACATILAPTIYYFLNRVFPGIPIELESLAELSAFFICLIFGISAGVSALTEYRIKNKR